MTVLHARMKYGLAMIVILCLATLTFVWPITSEVLAADARIAKLQLELEQSGNAMDQILTMQNRLQRIQDRLTTELKAIPQHADLPGLMKSITSDIAELPLNGSNVNRSRDTSINSDRSLGLIIETDGSFEGVFRLIQRIENLRRLVRINEVNIGCEPEPDNDNAVSASVDISAFYRPPATERP